MIKNGKSGSNKNQNINININADINKNSNINTQQYYININNMYIVQTFFIFIAWSGLRLISKLAGYLRYFD